ncbi:MAG: ribosome biogenesis GTPase YlqF, partial [Cyanobacteria bacterium NC_groundwater_1444_Ag_S-0.65um_54_12]|nr:ribosome biogenesis GTPase YlqF [Cyanobacteria bacterium NC_groundwater_1444_Ag_S-0.65um_54_12]
MDLPVIQWYPGHIAKSRRLLKEYLKVIDLVVEVADARIPVSSRFVGAKNLIGNKAAILALTKTDLADSKLTATWVKILGAVPVNACTGKGIAAVKHRMLELKRLLDEKLRS